MSNRFIVVAVVFACLAALASCGSNPQVPRPRGYFRISFPEKEYKQYDAECPFKFCIPTYSFLIKEQTDCWFNVYFPSYKATIYMTYRGINGDIDTLLNDAHDFAYKHTIKADAIEERIFVNDSARVFGCMYDIKGNVASPLQFFVTDSTDNFMRGSLYFDARPNKDSLAPVVDFIRGDVVHFIETFEWK
ncbi:MAG: gliding motility lipoprotein GldD [Bacteroidales bacterium]|nr:gliding motility lipoprotein GldD [Bacteroidales bacterium]